MAERPAVSAVPQDADEFYRELVSRSRHFIDAETQARIRKLKVFVAGCGSAGGACLEPLARLGVEHFRIADNGDYELTNLNRQHASVREIGVNKAAFHREELLRINPFIDVEADPKGVTPFNIRSWVEWADIVIDAVDVTTQSAMTMKFVIHEVACELRKPLLAPLDAGFRQWGRSYDYRGGALRPLEGRLERARGIQNPIKALFEIYPLASIPTHCLPLIHDLLSGKSEFASQLACAADLLSAVTAATVVRYATDGTIPRKWDINLDYLAIPWRTRVRLWLRSPVWKWKIRRLLARLS